MNIWWVFGYDQYYPGGALGDLLKTFDNEADARRFAVGADEEYDFVDVVNVIDVSSEEFIP